MPHKNFNSSTATATMPHKAIYLNNKTLDLSSVILIKITSSCLLNLITYLLLESFAYLCSSTNCILTTNF